GVHEVQLVTHDWGAAVALAFSARNPGRVRRVVLCNPPPLLGGSGWPRIVRVWRTPALGELVMGSIPKWTLARALRRSSTREDAWPDARVDTVWAHFDQGTQRAILRLVRSAGESTAASAGESTVAGGGSPTTVIWGEADPWYPPAVADAYAARLPGATVELVARAGHWPWLDRPEVVDRVAALLEG
ncbi:MAG: alpha/beta hydrolase, partial [Solirubrobacterales bacterium]|nr:alpha/beta hydrolase [Solirubrobacterales bacterium]